MNALGEAIGEICKVVLPIPQEFYLGNQDSRLAVCTLSSMDLLKKFKNSEIINQISIVGRLLSENKGIDKLVEHVFENKKINTILVCGKDVWGHRAGHSLFELHKNGVDDNMRIINSTSPDPILTVSKMKIEYFQKNISLINMVNETDWRQIVNSIENF